MDVSVEDAALIASLLAGDPAAIATVRGWVVEAAARFRGRLGVEVEDVEQEVLLAVMEALDAGRFRRQSRFETYVYSFARFQCIDRLRALGRRDMVELEESHAEEAPSPLEELTRAETNELARRVLAELPEQCRELWAMVAEPLSYREMAVATGLNEGTVRVRVHRCRQRAIALRQALLDRGGL